MITLTEREVFFCGWDELPARKRHHLMMLLPFLDDPFAKLLALRLICKKKSTYQTIRRASNSAELVVDLFMHGLKWITAPPISFAYPVIESRGWIFTAPDSMFSEVTFGAFAEMDGRFTRYLGMAKEAEFTQLMAWMYQVTQTSKGTPEQVLQALPYWYRLDAFRMFARVREKVYTEFKWLFPKASGLSEKEESKPLDFRNVKDSTPMWHSLIFSLAETPAYQGMKTAQSANMWEALTYLDEKAFQLEKSKPKT